VDEEMETIKQLVGEENYRNGKYVLARKIFDQMVLDENFIEFLTLPAYEYL
jgi:malate synthase